MGRSVVYERAMDWFRLRAAGWVWVSALLAWVISGTAALEHQYAVAHVWCAEHGELMELDRDRTSASASEGVTASASDGVTVSELRVSAEHHDHGCCLPGTATPTDELPVLLNPPVVSLPAWPAMAVTTTLAPRGPPLVYAPKTSPPATV